MIPGIYFDTNKYIFENYCSIPIPIPIPTPILPVPLFPSSSDDRDQPPSHTLLHTHTTLRPLHFIAHTRVQITLYHLLLLLLLLFTQKSDEEGTEVVGQDQPCILLTRMVFGTRLC